MFLIGTSVEMSLDAADTSVCATGLGLAVALRFMRLFQAIEDFVDHLDSHAVGFAEFQHQGILVASRAQQVHRFVPIDAAGGFLVGRRMHEGEQVNRSEEHTSELQSQ